MVVQFPIYQTSSSVWAWASGPSGGQHDGALLDTAVGTPASPGECRPRGEESHFRLRVTAVVGSLSQPISMRAGPLRSCLPQAPCREGRRAPRESHARGAGGPPRRARRPVPRGQARRTHWEGGRDQRGAPGDEIPEDWLRDREPGNDAPAGDGPRSAHGHMKPSLTTRPGPPAERRTARPGGAPSQIESGADQARGALLARLRGLHRDGQRGSVGAAGRPSRLRLRASGLRVVGCHVATDLSAPTPPRSTLIPRAGSRSFLRQLHVPRSPGNTPK
jgi:hypothetical protein